MGRGYELTEVQWRRWKRRLQGLTLEEIANEENVTISSVRDSLGAVRKKLTITIVSRLKDLRHLSSGSAPQKRSIK